MQPTVQRPPHRPLTPQVVILIPLFDRATRQDSAGSQPLARPRPRVGQLSRSLLRRKAPRPETQGSRRTAPHSRRSAGMCNQVGQQPGPHLRAGPRRRWPHRACSPSPPPAKRTELELRARDSSRTERSALIASPKENLRGRLPQPPDGDRAGAQSPGSCINRTSNAAAKHRTQSARHKAAQGLRP